MSKKNPKIPDLIESDENDNNWLTLNPNENNTNTNSEYIKIISAEYIYTGRVLIGDELYFSIF
jgi:hypothetical protein